MARFASRSFEISDVVTWWDDGTGSGCSRPAMAVVVEATHLLVASPREPWSLYSFTAVGAPRRLVPPEGPGGSSELLPVACSVAAERTVVAPMPLPSAETAGYHPGCSADQLLLWDWRARSAAPLEVFLDDLTPSRGSEPGHVSILGVFFDAEAILWLALEVRRGDDLSLVLGCAAPGIGAVRAGTVLATTRAGRAFIDEGWGFVRFFQDGDALFAVVGRPTGVEDRAFQVQREGEGVVAPPVRSVTEAKAYKILGRWRGSWVLLTSVEGSARLVLQGERARDTFPIARGALRLELLADQLIGFTDEGRIEALWLEAPELGWEEVEGCAPLHQAQRTWFISSEDLHPPFVAPVPVRCPEGPALFQVELGESGLHGVLCDPV